MHAEKKALALSPGRSRPLRLDADGLRTRFTGIADVRYDDDTHLMCGDVGISRWILRGTSLDGERIEVNGCDFYTLDNGKVVKKDSYWKIRQG